MGNCVTDWIFRRQRFCCCLPARLGAVLLSLFTILLGGLLMVIIWFEVSTNYFMSNGEKAAFIVAGLVETFLFIASVLGFIGACARKQLFVVVYATFLYVHFLINLGVAIYFLWEVTHAANTDIVKLCQEGIRNTQAEGQCTGLLNITKGVYWGVSLLVLAIEAYCALVVTRYVNQLRYEKRDVRRSRMLQRQSAYDAFHARFENAGAAGDLEDVMSSESKYVDGNRYSVVSGVGGEDDTDKEGLLPAQGRTQMFDPYEVYDVHAQRTPTSARSVQGEGEEVRRGRSGNPNRSRSPGSASDTDSDVAPVPVVAVEMRPELIEMARLGVGKLPPGAAAARPVSLSGRIAGWQATQAAQTADGASHNDDQAKPETTQQSPRLGSPPSYQR
ncbi:hypothetical protein M0805_003549 [Coniferiporia weirii]|nr:hypothetical protein M0805_003549 [Coniferiporia weirii]